MLENLPTLFLNAQFYQRKIEHLTCTNLPTLLFVYTPHRIIKWRFWYNVLWVHIEGRGGYFVSYRRLKQWLAACAALIHFCPTRDSLERLWECIEKESHRYTAKAYASLEAMKEKREDCLVQVGI